MSTVTSTPLTPEAARQQIQQLSNVYQLSKFFVGSSDLNALAQSGLFQPEEQAQIAWIARSPDVRQQLDEYARIQKKTVYMNSHGDQGTREQLDARRDTAAMRETLDAVTANIFGAMGAVFAQDHYPDDPEMQATVAKMFKSLGEAWFAAGETLEAAREHPLNREFDQVVRQDVPGRPYRWEPSEAPDTGGIPEGGKTFDRNEPLPEGLEGPAEAGTERDDPGDPPYDGPVDPSQIEVGYSYENPNALEPNQSFPEDRPPIQNVGDGPYQSFPEDSFPNESGPTAPTQSFPRDPIMNQSTPIEPVQSFPEEPAINQSAPMEPVPLESAPIESAPIEPISSEPSFPPAEVQSIGTDFDPG